VGLCIAKQAWAACLSFQLGEMHWGEEWLDSIKRAKATKAKIRNLIAEDQLRWRRQSAYAIPVDYIFVSKTIWEEQAFGPTTHESASAVQGRASRGSELRIDSPSSRLRATHGSTPTTDGLRWKKQAGESPASSAMIAEPLPIGSDLVAISASSGTAPAAMVRFGLVEEPQHTGFTLAAFHKIEVGCRELNCCCFGYRRKNSLAPV
jgi:hypothetical protein